MWCVGESDGFLPTWFGLAKAGITLTLPMDPWDWEGMDEDRSSCPPHLCHPYSSELLSVISPAKGRGIPWENSLWTCY